MLGEGKHNKVRLGQDRLAIKSGNERKLYTLFYPNPKKRNCKFYKFVSRSFVERQNN